MKVSKFYPKLFEYNCQDLFCFIFQICIGNKVGIRAGQDKHCFLEGLVYEIKGKRVSNLFLMKLTCKSTLHPISIGMRLKRGRSR